MPTRAAGPVPGASKIRFTNLVGMTESGNAISGYRYTSTAGGNANCRGSVANKTLPVSTNGSLSARLSNPATFEILCWSRGAEATQFTDTGVFGMFPNTTSYLMVIDGAGGVGGSGPASARVPLALDIMQLRRVGSDVIFEVSSDNGASWGVVHTHVGFGTNLCRPFISLQVIADYLDNISHVGMT